MERHVRRQHGHSGVREVELAGDHWPSYSSSFLSLDSNSNYFQNLIRTQISIQMKVLQNFELYKTYLRTQSQF